MTAERNIIDAVLQQLRRHFGPGYLLRRVVCVCENTDGVAVKLAFQPQRPLVIASDTPQQLEARHSPDFRSVNWYGNVYSFGPLQSAIVGILWEAAANGTPEVGVATLLERAGSDSDRLDMVFRGNNAWGILILPGSSRGTARLAEPPANGRPLQTVRWRNNEVPTMTEADDDEG